jgi:hypothetical protein
MILSNAALASTSSEASTLSMVARLDSCSMSVGYARKRKPEERQKAVGQSGGMRAAEVGKAYREISETLA